MDEYMVPLDTKDDPTAIITPRLIRAETLMDFTHDKMPKHFPS